MLLDQYQPRSAAAPSPDIINLKGKRLVWASETDEGRRLSLSRIKWLTGGDTLVGRPPNGKVMIEFRPSHTLFLLTNPLPHAPGDDYALWERVKLIHFPFSFVDDPKLENERQQDKELPDRLKTEATGILAWLVRGCIAWQKEGLGTAAAIQLATKGYQGEEDLVGQFLEECTIEDQSSQVQASELYGAYRRWSQAAGLTPKSSTWFGKQMRKRGVDEVKFGTVSYLGLALRRQETRQEQIPEQSG
jgi:putative DNA primase/helicase